jgi:cupin fold WbuC family metalloprotein
MKQFSPDYLSDLTEQAKTNDRLRQHRNVHQSFQDPCQRLFNAIEPGSYIRPHRHASDPRDELLVAIRGLMALITFDDKGTVTKVLRLGTEKYGPAIQNEKTNHRRRGVGRLRNWQRHGAVQWSESLARPSACCAY